MRNRYVQPLEGGPTVVVTGCSGGIGDEAARLLLARGYRVVATARRTEALAGLREAARSSAGTLVVRRLDVTRPAEVAEVIDEAAERGDLEAVVNNAGVAAAGFVDDLEIDVFRDVMEANFFGLVEVTRRALPHLRERRRGTIVQMSSGGGRFGLPMLAPYVASKHAVEGFSEVLRHEAKPWGVRVVLLEPGAFKTPMHLGERRLVGEDSDNGAVVVALAERVRNEVQRRGGDPATVAKAVVRAIEHPRPRLRRPVGADAVLTLGIKRYLPAAVLDRLARHLLDGAGYPELVAARGSAARPAEPAVRKPVAR